MPWACAALSLLVLAIPAAGQEFCQQGQECNAHPADITNVVLMQVGLSRGRAPATAEALNHVATTSDSEEQVFEFRMVDSGKCADHGMSIISDAEQCEEALTTMGLSPPVNLVCAPDDDTTPCTTRPTGCLYQHSFSLFDQFNGRNTEVDCGAASSFVCICKKEVEGPGFTEGGMLGELAVEHLVCDQDALTLSVFAHTGGQWLTGWWVTVQFDPEYLKYNGSTQNDLWPSLTCFDHGLDDGVVECNSFSASATVDEADGQGTRVPLMDFRFLTINPQGSGGGTIANLMSFYAKTMTDVHSSDIVNNAPAKIVQTMPREPPYSWMQDLQEQIYVDSLQYDVKSVDLSCMGIPAPAPLTTAPAPPPSCAACGAWCANNGSPWSSKCNWQGCCGCAPCSQAPPAPAPPPSCTACGAWCANNGSPWSSKCNWEGCCGCGPCQ